MAVLHAIGNAKLRVYANDHLPPHFHVVSPDVEALIEIATLQVMQGTLPRGKVGRAILAWAEDNVALIIAEWNRCNPFQI
jgi:hypothetical protein